MPKANPYHPGCPSRSILELIGGKWSMLLLCLLRSGPIRTGDLKRRVGGISQKMLTQTLRDLERNGIVQRIDYREVPPRVEYKLTRVGQSLSELVLQIDQWLIDNYQRLLAAQVRFDDNRPSP